MIVIQERRRMINSSRKAKKDVEKLVNILNKLPFDEFLSFFFLYRDYRNVVSLSEFAGLLGDALEKSRLERCSEVGTTPKKTKKFDRNIRLRLRNGVTPARLLKRRGSGILKNKKETDILDSGLTERIRHKI